MKLCCVLEIVHLVEWKKTLCWKKNHVEMKLEIGEWPKPSNANDDNDGKMADLSIETSYIGGTKHMMDFQVSSHDSAGRKLRL